MLWPANLRTLPRHPGLPARRLPLTSLLPLRVPTTWTQGGRGKRWQKHSTGLQCLPEMSEWAQRAPLGQCLALESHHLFPEVSGNPRAMCLPSIKVHQDSVLREACSHPSSPGPAPIKTSWISGSTRRNFFRGLLKACSFPLLLLPVTPHPCT